ncbi:MAG: hypothetical protein Q9159_004296 [Coniocarpon cinnabarinum]
MASSALQSIIHPPHILSWMERFRSNVAHEEGSTQGPFELNPEEQKIEGKILETLHSLKEKEPNSTCHKAKQQKVKDVKIIKDHFRECDNVVVMGGGTLAGAVDDPKRLRRRLCQLLFALDLAEKIKEAKLLPGHKIKLYFQDPDYKERGNIDLAILARLGAVGMLSGIEKHMNAKSFWFTPSLIAHGVPDPSAFRPIKIMLNDFSLNFPFKEGNIKDLQKFLRDDFKDHEFLPVVGIPEEFLEEDEEEDPFSRALIQETLYIRKSEGQDSA